MQTRIRSGTNLAPTKYCKVLNQPEFLLQSWGWSSLWVSCSSSSRFYLLRGRQIVGNVLLLQRTTRNCMDFDSDERTAPMVIPLCSVFSSVKYNTNLIINTCVFSECADVAYYGLLRPLKHGCTTQHYCNGAYIYRTLLPP